MSLKFWKVSYQVLVLSIKSLLNFDVFLSRSLCVISDLLSPLHLKNMKWVIIFFQETFSMINIPKAVFNDQDLLSGLLHA